MKAIFICLVEEFDEIFWSTYVVSDAFIEQNKKVSGNQNRMRQTFLESGYSFHRPAFSGFLSFTKFPLPGPEKTHARSGRSRSGHALKVVYVSG